MRTFYLLIMIVIFSSTISCKRGGRSELLDVRQEKANLTIILYNYRCKHEMKYPETLDELLDYDISQYGDNKILSLKDGWIYKNPQTTSADNPYSNFIILEKTTKRGDTVSIMIKDVQ